MKELIKTIEWHSCDIIRSSVSVLLCKDSRRKSCSVKSSDIWIQFHGGRAGLNHKSSFHFAFQTHFAPFFLSSFLRPSQTAFSKKVWTCSQCGICLAQKCKGSRNPASAGNTLARSLTHHLHSSENAITAGRLLAYFICCRVGRQGNVQPLREVGSWNTHHEQWNNVIMTWIIASQGDGRLSGADWPWGG